MNRFVTLVNDCAADWSAAIISACWLGGIALGLVWLISRYLPRIPATVRCWLWRLAYLKLLVSLVWLTPIEIPLLPPVAEQSAAESVDVSAAPVPAVYQTGETTATTIAAPSLAAVPISATPQLALSATAWMFLLWCMGVICCLLVLLWNWGRMLTTLARCRPVKDSRWNQIAAELATKFGVTGDIRLKEIDSPVSPHLAGVLRPRIILPAAVVESAGTTEARMILAHELAHWQRRDLLWNWLPSLASILFFFHPAVWFARREWQLVQEIACDEAAIRQSRARPDEYGHLLLTISRSCRIEQRPTFLTAGVHQSFHNLSRRITAMKRRSTQSRSTLWTTTVAVLILGVLGIVPWKLVAQEAAPTTVASAEANLPATEALAFADKPKEGDQKPAKKKPKAYLQLPTNEAALRKVWKGLDDEQKGEVIRRNLHGLVRAVHSYYETEGVLPPAVVPNDALPAEKRLSGFVLLLPHLDVMTFPDKSGKSRAIFDPKFAAKAKEIFKSMDLKKAWDDPQNLPAAKMIMPALLAPGGAAFRNKQGYAVSHYAFVRGANGKDDGAFTDKEDLTIIGGKDIIDDGTVNTFALGQVKSDLGPWTAAGNATARYVYHYSDDFDQPTFGSEYDGACYFANGDSYAYLLDVDNISAEILHALATRSGGEIIYDDELKQYRFLNAAEWKK